MKKTIKALKVTRRKEPEAIQPLPPTELRIEGGFAIIKVPLLHRPRASRNGAPNKIVATDTTASDRSKEKKIGGVKYGFQVAVWTPLDQFLHPEPAPTSEHASVISDFVAATREVV